MNAVYEAPDFDSLRFVKRVIGICKHVDSQERLVRLQGLAVASGRVFAWSMSHAAALSSRDLQQVALHSAHAGLVDIQGQPVVRLRTSAQFSFSCVGLLLGREFQFILGLSALEDGVTALT
ncbi:hypothetical protein [Hydrogenophaga sp.]|uniref:hypothetical protein n=1 Tax=Hydrogenophaga sp. TaxID=1904254 RepID=UPI00260F8C15|nr:hypothetical protein [Hydrogenophaga sp.]MDM7948050.1 hypothetical protein [Hydrogenophaga sp.]